MFLGLCVDSPPSSSSLSLLYRSAFHCSLDYVPTEKSSSMTLIKL